MKIKARHLILAFSLCIFSSLFSVTAGADVIILQNGDRITGRVMTLKENIVTIETEYAEPIRVRVERVQRIETNEKVEIHLKSGEIMRGSIITSPEGKPMVSAGPGRNATVIDWNEVTAVNPPPLEESKWSGAVTAGGGLKSGNNDRVQVSVGAEAERRSGKDRYSIRFLYNYAEEEEKITARNTYVSTKYDYFITLKSFGYIVIELLSDDFIDLNLRTVIGPGVGYQIWDDAVRSLLVEGGISYFSEDRDLAGDDSWITARLATSYRQRLLKSIVFNEQLILYPSLEHGGEYQMRNEASITSPLYEGWSFKLSNILEYDSDPPQGIESNDWQWTAGLQYGF